MVCAPHKHSGFRRALAIRNFWHVSFRQNRKRGGDALIRVEACARMIDADAEAIATPEATHTIVRSWPMPLESFARSESAIPFPVEASAIIRQAGVVASAFERLASTAVDLPAEIVTLLAEGKAASSTLQLEAGSTLARPEIVHRCYDELKRVLQKGEDPFIIAAAIALGKDVGHKIVPLADHLFAVDLPALIALIEHWVC